MAERLILIRHSGLRAVSEQEVVATLSADDRGLPRELVSVDTLQFADDVTAGDWSRSSVYLRESAATIQTLADTGDRAAELRYFGIAETPHVIALGAFLGDERFVRMVDYDRQRGEWTWPEGQSELQLETTALPAERLTQPGIAVLRVAISSAISDADVEAAVGRETLADVTIRPPADQVAQVSLVRSANDVERVRATVRTALSAIVAARPGVEVIHLFVAASVSASFVIGQELHLRSSVPVQTYRFRKGENDDAYTPAIRLTAAAAAAATVPLTAEERARAEHVRTVWEKALSSVHAYATTRQKEPLDPDRWFGTLRLGPGITVANPFPALPPIWKVVDVRDRVDSTPYEGEYGRDKDAHLWKLSDRLLLGLDAAAGGDDHTLQRLIQLFLFHEYLHEYNALTKYDAREVGSYPNCLEHIDYAADVYALLHQLGWAMIHDHASVSTEEQQCDYLVAQMDLVIRSFFAFDGPFPRDEYEVRRLRRYLNWYWRHVQVKRASPDLALALLILARRPAVELAGTRLRLEGRRIHASLTKRLPGAALSLALVLEDERIMRINSSVITPLDELLRAFQNGDHSAIQLFFNAVFEEAKNRHAEFPRLA